MSGEMFGTGAGQQLAEEYDVPYLGSIPLEANVRIGGDSGDPIVVSYPDSAAAQAIVRTAKDVGGTGECA